jgi:DNA-binding FadR family transcriptional regulator
MNRDLDRVSAPLRRTDKVAESVARDIVRQISDRSLRPGDKLPTEAMMVADYAVGRGTLREALRILEVNGLITIRPGPGGGPVVRGATADDFGRMSALFFNAGSLRLNEVVEARLFMEPVTARLAATRREAGPMLDRLVEIAGLTSASDDEMYAAATQDFHSLVVRMAGNGVIALFAESLAALFHDRVRGILFPPGRARKEVLTSHVAISQAIIEGRADEAESLMFQHMQKYVDFVTKQHPALMDEVVVWLR